MTGNTRTRPLSDSPEVLTDLPQKKEAVSASLIATWESEVLGWELTPGTWCLDGAT